MSEFAVTSTRRHTWFDDPAQPLTASFPTTYCQQAWPERQL